MLIIILIIALTNLSMMESITIKKEDANSDKFINEYGDEISQWHYTNGSVALEARQGDDQFMYDRFFIDENFDNTNVSLYAIFDGDDGSGAAEYATETLMPSLREKISTSKRESKKIDYATLLREEIIKTKNDLFKKKESSGTRVVIAVVDGEMVHFANAGYEKAVIYYEEPETPDGQIIATPHNENLYEMLGNFSTRYQRQYPENKIHVNSYKKLNSKFIILASGTFWDKISNENAVKVVKSKMNEGISEAAKELVKEGYKLLPCSITVIIIKT